MSNLIKIENLHKSYGSKQVLKGLNLNISEGKIVGLLGPNASGKTTLIKIINGLIRQNQGEVYIDGEKPGPYTKSIISYLPDRNYIGDWMKVKDILAYFKDFYLDFDIEKAKTMLEDFGIGLNEKFKTLSKGTKEKVQLTLVMSRDAKLFILDEPIAGVDPAARRYILDKIIEYFPKHSSLIIVTHLIADIESICDEVAFVKNGVISLYGDADQIREERNLSIDEIFREEFKCY